MAPAVLVQRNCRLSERRCGPSAGASELLPPFSRLDDKTFTNTPNRPVSRALPLSAASDFMHDGTLASRTIASLFLFCSFKEMGRENVEFLTATWDSCY